MAAFAWSLESSPVVLRSLKIRGRLFDGARGLQSRPWTLDERCQGSTGSLARDEREIVNWLLTYQLRYNRYKENNEIGEVPKKKRIVEFEIRSLFWINMTAFRREQAKVDMVWIKGLWTTK